MKTISITILFVISTLALFAKNEKIIESKINNVTVFTNSAQVNRSGSFRITRGISEIIFDSISPYINQNSINAKGGGDFIILDVQYRINQPVPDPPVSIELPPAIVRDIELLRDSLAMCEFDLQSIGGKKSALATEKTFLLNNKLIQGYGDTITEIKDAMTYLRVEMNDIENELLSLIKGEYMLTKEKNRMQARLNSLSAYNSHVNKPKPKVATHQVVVTIQSEIALSGKLEIDYIVNNAGWSPTYDIRAKGIDKPLELICKANVYQNSGESWDNVKLTLSSITPNQNKTKPYLGVLYLDYYQYQYLYSSRDDKLRDQVYDSLQGRRGISSSLASPADDITTGDYEKANTAANYTNVVRTMTNIEYDIPLPYTIPSDNKQHMVAVKNYDLNTEFYHSLVPKLDRQAYLMAKITDWEDLDILAGNANIYFEGTYVGETYLNPDIMADTMKIALGKDRGVIVERKKEKDEIRNVLIGSNVIKTIEYVIKIKNNKLSKINLIVEDQLPITQNKDITILPIEFGSAAHTETTGMLKWDIEVPAKSTEELSFSYTVEYNKNQTLANAF